MRMSLAFALAFCGFVALIVGTPAGHFAETARSPSPPAPPALHFSEFDMGRFEAAMAEGAALVVHLPDPARPERMAFAPAGVTQLTLDPAACPSVAASLRAWERGGVVAFHEGVEYGRVARHAPDGAVDALLLRLSADAHARSRSAPGGRP